MNSCTRSLDYLLEAELDELDGSADTEVGRHVGDCERCRVVAQKVLDRTARLDSALATVPHRFDVDALLRRARSAEPGPRAATISPLRRRWQRFATVALAASIVGLLILGDQDAPLPDSTLAPSVAARLPIVEAPATQNVAVISTDNPDITVLWFF